MMYREIIAVCSQIHTKHINTLCGPNVASVNVKLNGAYSNHWALEGKSNDFIEFVILMIYVNVAEEKDKTP